MLAAGPQPGGGTGVTPPYSFGETSPKINPDSRKWEVDGLHDLLGEVTHVYRDGGNGWGSFLQAAYQKTKAQA